MAEAAAYDVVFFVSNPELRGLKQSVGDYVETAGFAARYPSLRCATIRFSDPSTVVAIGDDACVIAQDHIGAVDIAKSRFFVYFPASFEPEDVSLHPVRHDVPHAHYLHRQWRVVAEYLEASLPRFGRCLNQPLLARAGCNKLIQRRAARSAGARLAPTMVANHRDAVLPLLDRGPAITKYLSETGRADGGTRAGFVAAGNLGDLRPAPAIVQSYIAAEYEYRVYVMGDGVTAIRIRTPDREAAPDARYRDYVDSDFTILDGLGAHDPLFLRITRELGLNYAVYDALPLGDDLFINEVNTNGTWFQWPAPIRSEITDRFHAFVHRLATG
ncbi:MAG: hypothetical protein EXQ94_14295 [Alphaproteobacteria bacterium]|nr:hypothetical protein [Alphaproteobacteria bacterium]